ncbi:hypothetical protein UFOVP324_44 [uncultured Caudovirales phage]|uniref:Uncharacterized protein n=1 Tax=uncultured Caudovirales phage TaxID=2100421 RepID=A0A6J5LXA0_9CAUD|nr:hypothetical protein UFOVP324_44 [uncultured Caudovirales phage]
MIASKGNTLRLTNEEDLKQVLRYAMLLVGLRANNMPTEEEKFVLINFIKTNFANVTIAQIKLAFDMAVAGKLQVDAKCYENFSCEFFGRIMASYLIFSAEETRIISQRKVEDEPLAKPSDKELKAQAIEALNMYADKVSKDVNFKWLAGGLHHLYDMAKELGLIKLNAEEKQAIWAKTKGDVNVSKVEAYKHFVNSMANFEMRFNSNGEIKPIE